MPDKEKENENLIPIRFHFYSIKFTPFKESSDLKSNDILFKVITYVSQQLQNGNGYLVDRYNNRKGTERREIFMNNAIIMLKEKRMRCSMALLRGGKQPMLKPADSFNLVPLDKANGSIVEQTHFFIDYSVTPAIICLEFNNNGPRISDIEYYFRNVSNKERLAKATEATIFMDNTIDKTLASLHNVLNFEMKLQPQKVAQMDNDLKGYISGISTMGNKLKPKFIKVEALFQSPGSKVKSVELNKDANNMILNFLRKFKGRPFNIDCFEHFEVKYEDKEGVENLFSLLKGKREVVKDIDLQAIRKTSEWYEIIKDDFDQFIQDLGQ
ncbi:hypothetical protein QT327_00885 [Olivibacter sp. 47]|uniref:hypothetical protein n=1 Tax=Olivibacter sp. 47 TaxID=3056486 RepID=UPI0025A390F4|nr:hypothetical protein [Olivibacter sp. 47]MDM8172911.1 hypothetical protein [Olivibacter sp. 47]